MSDHEVTLWPVTSDDQRVLHNLMQFYMYDFTEFGPWDPEEDGSFTYGPLGRYFDAKWCGPEGRVAFLVRVDGKLAGFAMKRSGQPLLPGGEHSVTEFFVMKRWRGKGIGKKVAFELFDRFPGVWQVAQMRRNLPAQAFWRKVIGEYTGGRFEEVDLRSKDWDGPVMVFRSPCLR